MPYSFGTVEFSCLHRNCFPNRNKKNSIKLIKFIGRQHLFLTEIIDKLNNCFSFQVNISDTIPYHHFIYNRSYFALIPIFQMIINIMETFILSVLAIYTINQYCFRQNETYKVYIYVTVEWFLLYLIATVIIIYIAHLVRSEVSKLHSSTGFFFTKM